MMPRPGSTTPDDGVNVEQELRARAPSIERSSTASELEERPSASCSSEGTCTTGHGASEEEEAYKAQFAVPDVVPPGTTMDFDLRRSPPGRKSAMTEDQPPGLEKPPGASARQPDADPDDARCYRWDHAHPIGDPNVPEPVGGAKEEKREHVELFINTLGSQEEELASRHTLMEVPDAETLEKKLRALQRALTQQKKAHFGSSRFRQKTATPAPPARAVHVVQAATSDSDVERDERDVEYDQEYDQGRDEEERADLFMLGRTANRKRETWSETVLDAATAIVQAHRSLAWKPVRDERSVSVFAFAAKGSSTVTHSNEVARLNNTRDSNLNRDSTKHIPQVLKARFSGDDYAREDPADVVNLDSGERRGYWKYYAPDKWHRQAKVYRKLNNRRAILLLDSEAEVSIVDTTYAREAGCRIDTSVAQDCVGIRNETYQIIGRSRIRVTLAGNLVYFMVLSVGDLSGQQAILGMNFMVPAVVRIDSADGTACIPDEVRISLIGRKQLYGAKHRPSSQSWVTRGPTWVTTLGKGDVGRRASIRVTNIGDKSLSLEPHTPVGWWTPAECVPRAFGFVRPNSRRYQEWQNLAFEAGPNEEDEELSEEPEGPLTDRSTYESPMRILRRGDDAPGRPSAPRVTVVTTQAKATNALAESTPREQTASTRRQAEPPVEGEGSLTAEPTGPPVAGKQGEEEADDMFFFHEGPELFVEELEREMAMLPDMPETAEVKIEDLKVGKPTGVTPEEAAKRQERLRQIIWKRRRWVIGKGNALPPAAIGVVCDIDVEDAKPGLINARMIQMSTSLWASPIVVIVKKNGIDIRLCIDYRVVNGLTRLMVYPIPLVNDLLEDLDKYPWMAFGLRNAPQLYQRLIDNALYGFKHFSRGCETSDVFTDGEPDQPGVRSVLERRLYIDDILIGGESWDDLCEKFERQLEACEKWHREIEAEEPRIANDPEFPQDVESSAMLPEEPQLLLQVHPGLRHFGVAAHSGQLFYNAGRDDNQGAETPHDSGLAVQMLCSASERDPQELHDLVTLNRLDEVMRRSSPEEESPIYDPEHKTGSLSREQKKPTEETNDVARVQAVATRSTDRQQVTPRSEAPGLRTQVPSPSQERIAQHIRLERIRVTQDEDVWMANLKKFLIGGMDTLSRQEARNCSKLADRYEVDEGNLLYYRPREADASERGAGLKLIILETIRKDVLHHYHGSLEGGHQGVDRTIRGYGVISTGPESLPVYNASSENVQTARPAKDARQYAVSHPETSWPLIRSKSWQWTTSRLCPCPNASWTAQTVTEAYKEAVFRRFGASEAIRHVREPGFMSDFFKAFNKLLDQRQRATLAYRPQANGAAERMVQTITRAIKMYITDVDQRDWDEYAERLPFALNTAQDRTRNEPPFYLVHGWDPMTTLESTLTVGNMARQDVDTKRWKLHIQRHYKAVRAQALELNLAAAEARAERQNEAATGHQIEVGTQVWLYLDHVKSGYARKLAHLCHGPFRVAEMVGTYAARLETDGTGYQLYPLAHISKLKAVRVFPTRPETRLTVPVDSRFGFDEELLPEDSWEPGNLGDDVFEVEKIVGTREGRATRYGRILREFDVKWKGYPDPT
ncbi:unnamed protein product [Phytophthora fragariaefolia]|uniref:Unnamed protein product n=1 Tax=Phytophthora fragariaefolia TaxID=1490495 RepID=A0A9W6XF52_9STRA|nr:unnamed protein product [Phytophthora fragariaefolia]